MYNEETVWFNQTLLTYKDKSEGTNAYLRISISSNTTDFVSFSPPNMSIQISDNLNKSSHINYSNSRDLINSFKEIIKTNPVELFSNISLFQIQKRYQKDQNLVFEFKTNVNGEYVLVIIIRNNETDFSKIIIPAVMIKDIIQLLSDFNKNYIQLADSLALRAITFQLTKLDDITREIKGMQSRIEGAVIPDSGGPSVEQPKLDDDIQKAAEATMDDLDEFLGNNMENIKVAEIDKSDTVVEKANIQEINSSFVEKVLKNDLSLLEPIIMNKSHVGEFFNFLEKQLPEVFNVVPGITEEQLKSLVYISSLFMNFKEKNYIEQGVAIPISAPILKYEVSDSSPDNLFLAFDLFLIQGYIKLFRMKMENKETDPYVNKALYHIKLRCITDPLIYSFIDKMSVVELSSVISSRFLYYNHIGFFNEYIKILEDNDCSNINLNDIKSFIDNVCEKGFNTPYIEELHNGQIETNHLRLPAKNNFNIEQIINEIIPLEIEEKLKHEMNFEDISDEVKTLFKQKIKGPTVKKENNLNPIQVYTEYFTKEFKDQNKIVEYLSDYGDKKVNIYEFPFPLNEFEEILVKGLYLWDPETMKTKKSILDTVSEDPLTKDLIIGMVNFKPTEGIESQNWNL
jgi:hypothetical protein